MRDAVYAANHATTPRDLIRAKNAAAKAFWSSGEQPTITSATLNRAPLPRSIAEMNQRARAFWEGRS